MASRWILWSLTGVSLLSVAAVNGCASDEAIVITPQGEQEGEQALGSLRLPLVTPEAETFRLRNAVFDISTRSGIPAATLDSEVNPDALALTVDLAQGFYDISLRDGWLLERLADDGTASPARAALVTPNPSGFSIRNDRVTSVVYTFTTDTGTVTFGEGSLSVSVGVVDPAALAQCDIVNQAGCPFGQSCLMADETGQSFCATPGTLAVGAECSSEQCVFGAQCLDVDPSAPGEGVCTALCNPAFPPFGCDCRSLSFDEQVGICGPPPAGACDLLAQTGCAEGQACQFPGGSFGVCGTPGTVPRDSLCLGEQCEAGLDCFGDDPDFGFFGTCLPFCDTRAPSCQGCFDVGTGTLGRCFF